MFKDKDEILGSIVVVVVIMVCATALLVRATHIESDLMVKSNCIADEAMAQGYDGSPYSEGAWQLFGDKCTK